MASFLIILREALSNRLEEAAVVISGRSETWGAILVAVNE